MACSGSATTTDMAMSRPKLERPHLWLPGVALLALTPKCLLCLLAYAGLGAALGLGGPELCGGTPGMTASSPAWLAGLGLAAVVAGGLARRRTRR